jgi:uncharacterized protein YutE (UPF0331/DUF86 family)/predicted nucleotidyltransferase
MADNKHTSIAEALPSGQTEISEILYPETLKVTLKNSLSFFEGISFAYLFGSAVRSKNFRDVDIAVYLLPCPSSSYERFKLAMRIGRAIEKSMPERYEVDVNILNEAPLFFQYEVIRTGQLIFHRDEQQRFYYEKCLLLKYLDYQPVWSALIDQYFKENHYMESQSELFQHLQEMDESLADWERYRENITEDDIIKNRDARNMVMHAMLISIQSCIDIANHIIVQRGLKRPSTYREAFEILTEASLVPKELSEELADLAGFRNVLVHIYWRIDIPRVYEILQRGLTPIKEFRSVVMQLLKE